MGLFKIFKRKKNFKLSKDQLQWNKMLELWADQKIESPYNELIEYMNGINNGGHYMHFDNISGNSDLKKYIHELITILPQPLKQNVELAYKTYIINPYDMSKESIAILDSCDNVYYENESIVTNILKERAGRIDL